MSRDRTGEAVVAQLESGRAIFLYALANGISLGSAWERALKEDPDFDLVSTLSDLAEMRALRDAE